MIHRSADTNTNFISDVYSSGDYAAGLISGGELDGPNNSGWPGPFTINGGMPLIDEGTELGGAAPTQVFDVTASPSSPNVIRTPNFVYAGVPLYNSGHSRDVYMDQGGVITGMTVNKGITFANLGMVVNGASFYCPDCDPPANPPVACTSSGAKTGSWVHGLNNVWVCTP